MRIQFEQSGGIVAGVRRTPVVVDTATLPPEEAKAWHDLVTAANFFDLPASTPAGNARDAFSYQVTVESGGRQHTVQTQGGPVPAALSPLIERLRQRARPRVG
jgi:hypothetical protein